MTPKEKAEELVNKFYRIIPLDKMTIDFDLGKKSALIAVNEIIKAEPSEKGMIIGGTQTRYLTINYWHEVKQEINKL